MNLIRCSQGHFYDSDKYQSCPHCGSEVSAPVGNETVSISREAQRPTIPARSPLNETAPSRGGSRIPAGKSEDLDETVSFYKSAIGLEPVVGWLVCVEGSALGRDFRLVAGRNFIGRGEGMNVRIEGDKSVSRSKHAIVVYEPRGNLFLVQPGESRELCYLNDKLVLATETLKANDILTLGSTRLLFIPCCTDAFRWKADKQEEKKGVDGL